MSLTATTPPGSGGIFWNEIACSLHAHSDVLLQDYVVGLGGGDVTTGVLDGILDDLRLRTEAEAPIFVQEVTA